MLASKSDAAISKEFSVEKRRHRSMLERGRRSGAVVDQAFSNFRAFLLELGPMPNAQCTVDRIDNNNPCYEPGNIRWATPKQQANNRSNTRFLTIDGETLPLTAWAERTGVKANTIRQRLARNASAERAVFPERFFTFKQPDPLNFREAGTTDTASHQWQQLGCTPANWEPYYRVWRARFARNDPVATRPLFATYICRNAISAPRGWDEDANGAYPVPPNAQQLNEIRLAALSILSPPEQAYLSVLRQNTRCRPKSPQEAAEVAKRI